MTDPQRSNKPNRDPLGKRALFAPPTRHDEQSGSDEGVKALYSSRSPWRPGTVLMECSDCRARTRVSVLEVAARILSFSIWIPGKSHSRWVSCPGCEKRTWSRIRWMG